MAESESEPQNFSIHALLAESDLLALLFRPKLTFLSTLSLRRATRNTDMTKQEMLQFSIHALLAESDDRLSYSTPCSGVFYPRSPCGERRFCLGAKADSVTFLSTLSLRRATPSLYQLYDTYAFLSTLSLRRATGPVSFFNTFPNFLSTLSLRRATNRRSNHIKWNEFSIHALLAESDKERVNEFRAKAFSIHALLAESDHRRREQSY